MKKSVYTAIALLCTLMLTLASASCAGGGGAKGAEFIFNNGTEPQSLDPSKIEGVPEHRLYMALFEGLVCYDPKTSRPVERRYQNYRSNLCGFMALLFISRNRGDLCIYARNGYQGCRRIQCRNRR